MQQNKVFESVGRPRIRHSSFDLSYEQKLSGKMGELIPTYLQEVLPNDHFKVKSEIMIRLAPMLAPIMHRVDVYMHYFFVPNRIIWNQWEDFITGGRQGTTNPVYPVVAFNNSTIRSGKLADYLGIPPQSVSNADVAVSQLPFRAYQKIYLDYYRDPNLVPEFDVNTVGFTSALGVLRHRAWEKDYFTSALPFLQRGPEVSALIDFEYKDVSEWYDKFGGNANTGSPTIVQEGSPAKAVMGDPIDPIGLRVENLEQNMSITIEELRRTSAVQRWLELMARGGYRYAEQIPNMFDIKSEDQRLQRAEYLGGGKQPIVISEVLNTTGTAEAPQGDMAGHGISTGTTNEFQYTVREHGYIMGIMSVIPKTAYFQGIPRHYLRTDKLDYYWPQFADLGEQPISNMEIFLDTAQSLATNQTPWGYQQRYAEYKYNPNTVHGDFRTTLDFWHMARKFSALPPLNAAFMEASPNGDEMTRIFAVESGDTLWCQLYHQVHARRPMPFFSDPKLS